MQLFSSKIKNLRRGSFAIFIDDITNETQGYMRCTYDIRNADDVVDDCNLIFCGTNATGAKAEADATKRAVAAIENFILII
jgi:hypothetical protein